MRIACLGAAETVTGSKFLVTTSGGARVLIDCGLYQGYKWLRRRNWKKVPLLDPRNLDAVVLTHAHLDHSGYVPVLYKKGYRGPVFCHHATAALAGIMLPDSGHIHEEDARYHQRHGTSKHDPPEPLYDARTAEESLSLFQGVDFHRQVQVKDLGFHLQPAGHILGAGSVILEADGRRVGFSGDVGRQSDVLMRPPEPLPELDMLFLESTYGDRAHPDADVFNQIADTVNEMVATGGVLLIPSFAVGRAQALMHILEQLMASGRIPQLPVYLDSPMAIDVSDIYCRFADQHRLDDAACARMCRMAKFTRDVPASKAIADENYPHIIIAGSGMATGGRILHHMKRLLGDQRTFLMLAGFQAGGTRGDKLARGADAVRIHGQWIDNRADVRQIRSLSAHADPDDFDAWLDASRLGKDTKVQLIHGNPEALEAMRDHLRRRKDWDVDVAEYRAIVDV